MSLDADALRTISSSGAQSHRPQRRVDWFKIALTVFSAAVLLFLVAPVLIVIPMSFSAAQYLTFPPPGCRSSGMRTSSPARTGRRRHCEASR